MTTTATKGTIEHEWRDYCASVIPASAGAVQINESRRAFYAGAKAMFALIDSAAAGEDEDAAAATIGALDLELESYLADLKAGRA